MSPNISAADRERSGIRWVRQLQSGIRRHSHVLSVLLFISIGSKILGLVREVYISSHFGVSQVTDAFFGVQQFPSMLQNYMIGAFTLAFVPHFAALKLEDDCYGFLKRQLAVLTITLSFPALMMVFGAHHIAALFGGAAPEQALAARFSTVLAISMIPCGLIGISYSTLHAEMRHNEAMLLVALPPAIMLLVLVGSNYWMAGAEQYALPWSYTVGCLVGGGVALYQIVNFLQRNKRKNTHARKVRSARWTFTRQLSAASVENVSFNVNQLLTVYFAARSGADAVALNAYALRIAMLPMTAIVSPLNLMVGTWLTTHHSDKQKAAFIKALAVIGSAGAFGVITLICLRTTIVRLIYQHGVFSGANTTSVANVLVPYSIYILIMALTSLFARFYFATGMGGLYCAVLLSGYLIANVLKWVAATRFGLQGIISSSVFGEGLALLILAALFTRYRGKEYA